MTGWGNALLLIALYTLDRDRPVSKVTSAILIKRSSSAVGELINPPNVRSLMSTVSLQRRICQGGKVPLLLGYFDLAGTEGVFRADEAHFLGVILGA